MTSTMTARGPVLIATGVGGQKEEDARRRPKSDRFVWPGNRIKCMCIRIGLWVNADTALMLLLPG